MPESSLSPRKDGQVYSYWRLHARLRGHLAGRGARDSLLVVELLFRHACNLGLEGIVSKRKGLPYRSGRSPDWLKMKSPDAPAVKREAEEDWSAATIDERLPQNQI